jgi:predicted nucleic acid-binding protein
MNSVTQASISDVKAIIERAVNYPMDMEKLKDHSHRRKHIPNRHIDDLFHITQDASIIVLLYLSDVFDQEAKDDALHAELLNTRQFVCQVMARNLLSRYNHFEDVLNAVTTLYHLDLEENPRDGTVLDIAVQSHASYFLSHDSVYQCIQVPID